MENKKIILIDLGTNTAIFSVVEFLNNKLIISYEKSITTRIGQNIGCDNIISEEVLLKNIEILRTELEKIKASNCISSNCGITTEAIRKAKNGTECIENINRSLGIKLDVITGEQEAFYTWLAVKHLVKNKKSIIGVCDIGGGSTEITIVQDQKILFMKSFPVGVVRLEEEFHLTSDKKNLDTATNKLLDVFDFDSQKPDILFLSGGTATSTAAIMSGINDYDPVPIDGVIIKRHELDKLFEKLFNSSTEQLKDMLRSDPGRYDVITAGVLMIKTIMEKLKPSKTIVTTYGPRHGYIMDKQNIKEVENIIYRLNKK
ncbi:MAG: hypothetical protein NTY22_05500 [Proteobacteria bacterium]|nr:hypothetical protein [Pseudomonadota bacterium]